MLTTVYGLEWAIRSQLRDRAGRIEGTAIALRSRVRTILCSLLAVSASLALAGVARGERLVDVHQIARGGYVAPRFAPDGGSLLVSGPKLRGLYLARLSGGVRQLCDDEAAGVHARYTTSGAIAYSAVRDGVHLELVLGRDGAIRRAAPAQPVAFARDDRMYAQDRGGQLVRVGSGDRFFGAVIAPDEDHVAFQGLTTGIYVYTRSTGRLVHVGAGTAPAWSPDSKRLAFEQTEDDGHDIVASDLYVYDLAAARITPLTTTDRVTERRPSFSPDGASIAYDDGEGAIYLGRLEVSP